MEVVYLWSCGIGIFLGRLVCYCFVEVIIFNDCMDMVRDFIRWNNVDDKLVNCFFKSLYLWI